MPKGPLTIAEDSTGATDGPHPLEGTRRRLTPRQAEVVMQLVRATGEEVEEVGYAGLTVRTVARRAGVAPATAYTYFSSKNHLVAEAYLDLVRQVPFFTDVNDTTQTRVGDVLRHLALVVADDPEVAAACTTALLSGNDPTVAKVRDSVGAEIHRRIASAIGPEAEPGTVDALEMAFFGALVQAGSGAFTYRQITDRLTYVVGLILGDK
jgi:AcrR family transcriptional regulator